VYKCLVLVLIQHTLPKINSQLPSQRIFVYP